MKFILPSALVTHLLLIIMSDAVSSTQNVIVKIVIIQKYRNKIYRRYSALWILWKNVDVTEMYDHRNYSAILILPP